MGLVGAVLTALAQPAPLTLMKPEEFVARPARWLQAISRYRATISAAPHFAYELALERIRDDELEGVDLSCWLLALDGAEPVTASTLTRFCERFRSFGFRKEALTPVYGLAEASLAVTFSRTRPPLHLSQLRRRGPRRERGRRSRFPGWHRARELGNASSRSRRRSRLRSAANDFPGRACRPRSNTRIVGHERWDRCRRVSRYRGPRVLLGGELHLCGRSRDLLILRGRNYPPELIEQALDGVPGSRAGAVAAVSHPGSVSLGSRGARLRSPSGKRGTPSMTFGRA